MNVPFVDMARLHAGTRQELLDAFARVLDSGAFVQGPEVEALEREVAATFGVKHALAVQSGTAALHLALVAAGVRPGDEVITVANTFIATAEAISQAGARPVFVDIDPETMNIDPAAVERAITPRTRAIVPVHLYGRVAPMSRLLNVAYAHNLRVIEDACQAHGACLDGRLAGTFGDAGCFSFYPTKNIGTVGEGGLVVTDDGAIAARIASLRNHGQAARHHHSEPGYNYRMPELQAAAVRVLLPRMPEWNTARVGAAHLYDRLLASSEVVTPVSAEGHAHVYHLYVVRTAERERLQRYLADRGIATAVHYPTPIHLQPAYASEAFPPGSLPHTEAATREILSLPMHPNITEGEVIAVANAIHSFSTLAGGER